ncbi:hypothetical protein DUNSADRAFT_498 [Dunaliella salina]|uniref:RING-type domain-containing protein n=1 Tax=Dunaliella salina TaxID=3046 RepID=A0ABQ7FYS9_DUNSA|nr:hypothetical protein DUNSADRAFT_498 [Dunaliella salina]|eukprot:KAF5827520.1 hypothetical protein DUNSADRAFT_498 [Dunaliella salina]
MQRGVTPEQAQANSSDLQAATNSRTHHDCGSQHKGSKGGSHRGSRRGPRPEGKTNGAPRRDSQGLRPSSGHGRREEGSMSAETSVLEPPLSRSPSTASSSRPEKFKGISANHLLCFQSHASQTQGGRSGASSGKSLPRKRFSQPRPQKFDRNKFLQANYRFVVSDAVNASLHYADADRMFEWEDVLQVELLTSAPLSCPISLDNPPRCPQITPCGHIFSFPAIMAHLLHAGGPHLRRSAPCPLCFAPLISRDLRLVSTTSVIPPKVGQPMVFQLLKRGRTTIVPTILGEPQASQASAGGSAANTAAADEDVQSGTEGGGGSETGGNARPSNGSVGTGSNTLPKPGKHGSNVANAKSPASSPVQPPLAGVATGQLGPLAANCFSKFAVVGLTGAGALWEAAARDLAAYAAEVMAWGGEDAAVEAPSVYAALDVLAVRARRASASASASGSSPQEACSGLSPEQQGAYAEAQVKKMFVGAVDERALAASLAEVEARQAEEQRAREALFPSLLAGSPPPRQPTHQQQQQQQQQQRGAGHGSGLPPGRLNAGAASFSPQGSSSSAAPAPAESKGAGRAKGDKSIPGPAHYMPAFSDDEEEEEDEGEEGEEGGGESEHGPAFAAETRAPRGDHAQAGLADKEDGAAGGSSEEGSAGPGEQGQKLDARERAEGGGGAGGDAGGQGPGAAAMRVADKQVNSATPGGDFYMYQAGDGQWVFMDPLNLKCLLHHYGSYECCPPTITARVLEVESIEQLAEVALGQSEGGPLPPAALAPFADELGAREKRRRRRAAAERKAAADSAAAARNARNARQVGTAVSLPAALLVACAVFPSWAPVRCGVDGMRQLSSRLQQTVQQPRAAAEHTPGNKGMSRVHLTSFLDPSR